MGEREQLLDKVYELNNKNIGHRIKITELINRESALIELIREYDKLLERANTSIPIKLNVIGWLDLRAKCKENGVEL